MSSHDTDCIDVSIVVPAYNSAPTLRLLLDVVTRESSRWKYEIIVVDDGSTDGTRAVVRRYPAIRYLVQRERGGPSRARNRGAREAAGAHVIFIDSDIVPERGVIDRLMTDLTRRPGVSGVAGIYAEEPLFNDGYVTDFRNLQTHYWKISSSGPAVANFPISLSILRKADFFAAGALHESYKGADVEDFDLGRRMTAHGFTTLTTSRVRGFHHPEETLAKLLKVLFRRSAQFAATLWSGAKLPSHYATKARSITIGGSAFILPCLIAGAWHWTGFMAAAGVYGILVVWPERDYYRFLLHRRKGMIFLYYCGLQFLSNLSMAAGLAAGFARRAGGIMTASPSQRAGRSGVAG